ncbi:MAG: hypothetical protein WCB67_00980 [Solirubrobacteraceae bacterium]
MLPVLLDEAQPFRRGVGEGHAGLDLARERPPARLVEDLAQRRLGQPLRETGGLRAAGVAV